MAMWRANIKTAALNGFDPNAYCISNNLVGVGWPVEDDNGLPPKDLSSYIELGKNTYPNDNGWWVATNALGNRMSVGDICWTRNASGVYYVGMISSDWKYLHGFDADNFDIHCVRECSWQKAGLVDVVPGAVERSFGPARTVQMINDATSLGYSEYLYQLAAGGPLPSKPSSPDLFGLLSPADHEDLTSLYLQVLHDFVVIPSTVKKSTAAYEWVMVQKFTGVKAVVQVKSGGDIVEDANIANIPTQVFIVDGGTSCLPGNSIRITRKQLLEFATARKDVLPARVLKLIEWLG